MKVDWKRLSQCEGYKSLKAAYIRDVQKANRDRQRGSRHARNKAEFRKAFQRAISTTIANAAILGVEPWDLLDQEEGRRDHWWINFYSEFHYPLLKPVTRTYPKPKDTPSKSSKRRWTKEYKKFRRASLS